MKRLLYYPTFEVLDENWLKFALLYIDKLHPIIPLPAWKELSQNFKKIKDETDLIAPFTIEKNEGKKASLDAIEKVDSILRFPGRYESIFGDVSFLKIWKSKSSQDFLIFEDKYTDDWERFVEKSNLGHRESRGVNVNKNVAYIYMTILAHVMGDKHSISPITDHILLDKFSVFVRQTQAMDTNAALIAKRIIQISLPRDLENASIKDIIKLRERRNFKEMIGAFHKQVEEALDADEDGDPVWKFFEKRGNIIEDLSDVIGTITGGTVMVALSVWSLLSQDPISFRMIAKTLAEAGVTYCFFKNAWKYTKPKRFNRKYLHELYKINSNQNV